MKKNILFIILLILFSLNVSATCYNDTVCNNEYTNIYPQNINNFDGLNDIKEVIIENPSKETFNENIIKQLNDDSTISINNLKDETNIEFIETGDEFFDELLKENAEGNLNLFTQKDLNRMIRDKTINYTLENVNWIYMMIIMIVELFKIIVNVLIILIAMWLFFRMIPLTLKAIKNVIFKILVRVER